MLQEQSKKPRSIKEFLKSYIWAQFRFSLGNIPSIPIGGAALWFMLFEIHVPYPIAYVSVFIFTTSINLFFQVILKVVKVK